MFLSTSTLILSSSAVLQLEMSLYRLEQRRVQDRMGKEATTRVRPSHLLPPIIGQRKYH
jgi:hypothetical protein